MGQAKARGDFEQRKTQAIAAKKLSQGLSLAVFAERVERSVAHLRRK